MLTLNLYDSNFAGQVCSVANQTPKTCRYMRFQRHWDGITLFTDRHLYDGSVEACQSRYKVGWLHEGRELRPENYDSVGDVLPALDGILTTEKDLWARDAKFWPTIRGGCWIREEDRKLYPKTKMTSMILSEKDALSGHRLRHQVAQTKLPIDKFGPGHQPIGVHKHLAYRDYRFALVIEASRRDNWFSEHLLDCIAYGTIPIYWGCPNLDMYLDPKGILPFSGNLDDLNWLLPHLSESLYEYMLPHARNNLELIKQYAITEDWFVPNILEPYFGL